MCFRRSKVEKEYFNLLSKDVPKNLEQLKRRCREDCQRKCGQTPKEMMECLANLMTIEYLLDNS